MHVCADINMHLYIFVCMYVCMYVCVRFYMSKRSSLTHVGVLLVSDAVVGPHQRLQKQEVCGPEANVIKLFTSEIYKGLQ